MNYETLIRNLLLGLMIGTTAPITPNPDHTAIVFDFDYVIADINHWRVVSSIGGYLLTNPSFIWQAIRPGYALNDVLSRVYGIHTSGKGTDTTYNLIDIAHAYPPFKKSFDSWFQFIQSSVTPVPGILTIIRTLKDRGYTLVIATNRDRVAFELAYKKLGPNRYHNGVFLFDLVVTTKPNGYDFIDRTMCPKTQKRFSTIAPNQKYDLLIKDIPFYKPDKHYYKELRTIIDTYVSDNIGICSARIVFFDDAPKNVNGAIKSGHNLVAFHVPANNRHKAVKKSLKSIGIYI